MKSFTFTDPATGREFTVQAPDGTSLSQAKAVFEQQLGSGKLASISIGATLDSATQSLGKLKDIPVVNGIDLAALAKQVPAQLPIGSMSLDQVSASLAQTAKDVAQAATAVSADKGVGQYGISPQQLEAAGFIKPGTVSGYLKDPSQIQSVLGNPAVWTGKKNVGGLDQLLGDVKLQSLTQNEIMVGALDGLKQAGALSGREAPEQLASMVQLGSKFGVGNAVSWVQGQAPAEVINQMNAAAKNAQFSVNLSDKVAESGQALKKSAEGFKATVNRANVNRAFADVLGDPKIPVPSFSPVPETLVEVTEADIEEARNLSSNAADVQAGLPPEEWNVTPEQLARNKATSRSIEQTTGLGEGGANRQAIESVGADFRSNIESSGITDQLQGMGATKVFISPAERISNLPSGINPDRLLNQPITDLTSRLPFNPRRT